MTTSSNKILVPIDFSEQSLIALEQSYNLAREYHAEITLLHVIEEAGVLSKLFSKEQHDDLKKNMKERLDELASAESKKAKLTISTLVARGSVYEKINEVAELINAGMIIMGTNGDEGLKKRFIGSNALRVVRESKIPVITIKGKHHRKGCKNIVLPLDLSKETREKVTKAIELSKLFGGATIRVVSVLFTTDEFVVNRITRQLGQVKSFLEKENVECSAEIIKGIKGEETLAQNILEYAQKVEGDLIMIMTQQEVDFTLYFIGSSAQEIINHSPIPVLSIRPVFRKDTTSFPNPY
ncbi:MAG: universal stress protein UspA-like protein [Bacteroidota bacterium]|jgi:nucleotide-binding universal stress UspA family protein|nr:universal stress protein UspA-like protein [Bacteroidota bacterium]